jgi:hypothetical protein
MSLSTAILTGPAWNILNSLFDDFQALKHLSHTHKIPRVTVTALGTDNVEIQIFVSQIRLIATKVTFDSAGSSNRAACTKIDCVFRTQVTNALRAIHEDAVLGQQTVDFVVDLWKLFDELANSIHPVRVHIKQDTANAGVAGMEPLARSHFDDVVDVLALLEEIQERGESTKVEGSCTQDSAGDHASA